jgi:hypothetical protein
MYSLPTSCICRPARKCTKKPVRFAAHGQGSRQLHRVPTRHLGSSRLPKTLHAYQRDPALQIYESFSLLFNIRAVGAKNKCNTTPKRLSKKCFCFAKTPVGRWPPSSCLPTALDAYTSPLPHADEHFLRPTGAKSKAFCASKSCLAPYSLLPNSLNNFRRGDRNEEDQVPSSLLCSCWAPGLPRG